MDLGNFDSMIKDAAGGNIPTPDGGNNMMGGLNVDDALAGMSGVGQNTMPNFGKSGMPGVGQTPIPGLSDTDLSGLQQSIMPGLGQGGNPVSDIASSFTDGFGGGMPSPDKVLGGTQQRVQDFTSSVQSAMPFGKHKGNDNDAFHGKIVINNKKYGVVECTYDFTQACDSTGKPSARPRGGRITFTMPSQSDDDVFFYRWMFNKTQVYDGYLKFVVWARQNKRCFKTINFKDAYCVGLKDYFNDSDSKLMYTTVTIVAGVVTVGINETAKFDNDWT